MPPRAGHSGCTQLCRRDTGFQLPEVPTLGALPWPGTLVLFSPVWQHSWHAAFHMERAGLGVQHLLLAPKPPLQGLPCPQPLRGPPLSPGVWPLR